MHILYFHTFVYFTRDLHRAFPHYIRTRYIHDMYVYIIVFESGIIEIEY